MNFVVTNSNLIFDTSMSFYDVFTMYKQEVLYARQLNNTPMLYISSWARNE